MLKVEDFQYCHTTPSPTLFSLIYMITQIYNNNHTLLITNCCLHNDHSCSLLYMWKGDNTCFYPKTLTNLGGGKQVEDLHGLAAGWRV